MKFIYSFVALTVQNYNSWYL